MYRTLLMLVLIAWLPLHAGDKAVLNPKAATEKAPETFQVKFTTTKGEFTVKCHRQWAPIGVDRLYNMVKVGYFKDIAFYRVIDGFMAQFGFSGDPAVNKAWGKATIRDEPVLQSNTIGRLTFAKKMSRDSRTTQFFINTSNNTNLDRMGFAPLGEVEGTGMEVVKSLNSEYGEGYPRGRGPDQRRLEQEGLPYLKKAYPNMDYILKAEILPAEKKGE